MADATKPFTDLAMFRGDDGIYDIAVDPITKDFVLTAGFESSAFVSLFTDRRARADEVPDPMKRRGWIGNLVSVKQGDNIGSGLWLYEQSRLTDDILASLRIEAEQAFDWMVEDGLARYVTARTGSDPRTRELLLYVDITALDGNVTSHAFPIIQATKIGLAGSN